MALLRITPAPDAVISLRTGPLVKGEPVLVIGTGDRGGMVHVAQGRVLRRAGNVPLLYETFSIEHPIVLRFRDHTLALPVARACDAPEMLTC